METRLRISPLRWISFGLLTRGLRRRGAWLFARPFLTSYAIIPSFP